MEAPNQIDILIGIYAGDSPKAIHARIAPKQTSRSYTTMVMTHRRSTAPRRGSLNIGLQSFLFRSGSLKGNIPEQIRLSQSQRFRFLLNRFYPDQDDFSVWNHISDFQRTKTLYSALGAERQGNIGLRPNTLYPCPEGQGFTV